jgi:muramoyltetrapeptide carboxypeptidase LdcA involved in peptidoglycan recycling
MDEVFDAEYRCALVEVVGDPSLPILCNLNVGHAAPRCIIPLGVSVHVDADAQRITFG